MSRRLLACAMVGALAVCLVAAAAADAQRPRLGRTAVVELAKGTVLVKERGKRRFARLRGRDAIPLGSTVDATRGQVRLRTAGAGITHTGVLSKGAFTVTQTGGRDEPVTELQLPEATCGGAARAFPARRINRLRGRTRGRHRSRGSHTSANIYGTTWESENRCDGTQHRAVDGEIEVTDGQTTFNLPEGFVALWYCEPLDAGPLERAFCLIELGDGDLWGFAIAARTDRTGYDFCVLNPYGQEVCRQFEFDSTFLDANGGEVKYGDVFCLSGDGPGLYFAGWGFDQQLIGVPFPFIVTVPPREGICPFDQEEAGLPEAGVTRSAFREVRERVPSMRGRTPEALPLGGGGLADALRARAAGGR